MSEQAIRYYDERTNPHPRGFIGQDIANHLLRAGWREEIRQPVGYLAEIAASIAGPDRVWISPDGELECTLEQAYYHLTGHSL